MVRNALCFTLAVLYWWLFRGDEFRSTFAEIGSVRSLIPRSVKVLALTATATKDTLESVISRLSLQDPAIIGLPPDRINIKYIVKECPSMKDLCHQLSEELSSKRSRTPKTVLFCRSLQHCANIFATIKRIMGENITEPPGTPPHYSNCLISVFTSVSTTHMRELLLQEFSTASTNLRLLIATTAFGLGVDCPDIQRVINWGSPSTLEELVQEAGRSGRDGRPAEAILYPKAVGRRVTKAIQDYQENTTDCRRVSLFKNFLFATEVSNGQLTTACACCDLCSKLCNCVKCIS